MSWRELNCLDFSDIHMGHPDTPTENIIQALKHYLELSVNEKKIDMIFFSGDQFDRMLNVPTSDTAEISSFIAWLCRFLKTNHIKLRVLEGTPSHDWRQNYLFNLLNNELKIGADIRYHDRLCIDYEEDYDLHILYVPDEWGETNDDTLHQVKALLANKGLEKVDLAIMHGMFAFQLPEHLRHSLPTHDQEEYEKIVDKLIVIGHYHRHNSSGKVVVPGSFDRLCHGEEDPKGFIQFTLRKTGKPKVVFIENKFAIVYRSIILEDEDVSQSLERIENELLKLPEWSRVRLVYKRGNPIAVHLRELRLKYPSFYWSSPKVIKVDEQGVSIKEVVQRDYTAIILNRENLEEKVLFEISLLNHSNEAKQEPINLDLAAKLLREAMKNVRNA